MATKQRGLGRGLGALIDDFSPEAGQETITKLPLQKVEPNPNQPRRSFDEEELQALADSIAEHGILQPLAVRALDGGFYQIIAGERRWRAARMAGLSEVPVVVLDADDRTVMELALIENLQRQDLNPMEEAMGYSQLMEEYDLLELFMKKPGQVFSREQLLNLVWGYDYQGDIRTVDVHIRRLREKLEANPAEPEYILTKWGVGYYFVD